MTDDLEGRLRTGLAAAAEESPPFVAPDLDQPVDGRRRRWPIVAAAVAVLAAGAVGYSVLSRPSGGGEASCAFVVRWEGRSWSGIGSDRTPVTDEVLGEGVVPRCDDGNGASDPRRVQVLGIEGVDPTQAVVVNGAILLPADADGLPEGLEDAQKPVACRVAGTVELVGRWTGVVSTREARVDGDVRPPYRIDFETSDPRVTEGYATVLIQAAGTRQSRRLTPAQVKALLGQEAADVLTTHCRGDEFVVDSLGRAAAR